MKLKPEETPDTYKTIEVVAVLGIQGEEDLVKVHRCTTEEAQVFFHVVHEPLDISKPDDIQTVHSYRLIYSEPEEVVRTNAIMSAERYYRKKVCR